ncbi:hypothetical protein K443DRAFT_7 [Laccaria amethystina LaAM-08-1]|uniref:Unplaced genomic scaffold K443scaffold_1, whole genome shotgun sequence n=1 Tax=Laccaria amethystina LaAM-08-1 TaxID=1095629 RepID=A0A0C9YIA3_9AGAR|nr:hypothetical protein K443DRAFT_7 [Laccaria amethystina LaAM-08-1]
MQELPSTKFHRNGIRGIRRVPNDVQIEHRHLPTLDLGIINKQTVSSSTTTTTLDDVNAPSPLHHHRLIATATSLPHQAPPASAHLRRPQPLHHERRGNATSPTERAPATSAPHNEEEDATSLGATWQDMTNDDIVVRWLATCGNQTTGTPCRQINATQGRRSSTSTVPTGRAASSDGDDVPNVVTVRVATNDGTTQRNDHDTPDHDHSTHDHTPPHNQTTNDVLSSFVII